MVTQSNTQNYRALPRVPGTYLISQSPFGGPVEADFYDPVKGASRRPATAEEVAYFDWLNRQPLTEYRH